MYRGELIGSLASFSCFSCVRPRERGLAQSNVAPHFDNQVRDKTTVPTPHIAMYGHSKSSRVCDYLRVPDGIVSGLAPSSVHPQIGSGFENKAFKR